MKLRKEMARFSPAVKLFQQYEELLKQMNECKDIIKADEDKELSKLAEDDLSSSLEQLDDLIYEIEEELIPKS